MTDRRKILTGTAAFAALAALGACRDTESAPFQVDLTEDEWRARLTEAEFAVLRQAETEEPYSSPLNENETRGTYICAGCENPVYASETKFESGTGWPSFWQPVSADAVGTKPDYKLVWPRTEVHCARCGGHLGHVFDDGPEPTGERHCINGVALDFVAA